MWPIFLRELRVLQETEELLNIVDFVRHLNFKTYDTTLSLRDFLLCTGHGVVPFSICDDNNESKMGFKSRGLEFLNPNFYTI